MDLGRFPACSRAACSLREVINLGHLLEPLLVVVVAVGHVVVELGQGVVSDVGGA